MAEQAERRRRVAEADLPIPVNGPHMDIRDMETLYRLHTLEERSELTEKRRQKEFAKEKEVDHIVNAVEEDFAKKRGMGEQA